MVVRGRHVMRGYWNNPAATQERFRPGPLPGERVCHTGDLFRMDENGFLYFVSRQDDIIKSRGEKVSPIEVENVLYGIEGVTDSEHVGDDADAHIGRPRGQGARVSEVQRPAGHIEKKDGPRYQDERSLGATGHAVKVTRAWICCHVPW